MVNNYGSGVSRVLDPTATQYTLAIWQQGKPPLDAELNLLQDIASTWQRQIVLRGVPSGWLGNETNASEDILTSPIWSNWWRFGRQRTGEQLAVMWAVVNGWVIPVTGTRTGTPPGSPDNTDSWNVVALDPPPSNSGDFRSDFAFLEVWLARVPPNPATLNKPAATGVYKYGNVEGGYTFISDDITDPSLGFETTERVQLQYRIRVAKGLVGLTSNPDGFDPTVVFGQGAATAATSYTFTNMRQTLGDPGLWRAGDGTANTLGTVDGFTYAIPLAAVFRRNAVAWSGDPSQNLNGSFNRNPTAVDRTGILTFSASPTLGAAMAAADTTLTLSSAVSSAMPLPASPSSPVLIQIGDELLTYTAITGSTMTGLSRGVNGTRAEKHANGAALTILSGRPDGLFADQIAKTDVLDLRHIVNPNGFDFDALLQANLDKLLRGQLRANWKRTGAGPQGPFCSYQDKITGGSVALGVTKLDAPDNIRMVFSDAATVQRVTSCVTPPANPGACSVSFDPSITVTQTTQVLTNNFSPTDFLVVPIIQFKSGVSGGDSDQIRFYYDGDTSAVTLRLDGYTDPLSAGPIAPATFSSSTGSTTAGSSTFTDSTAPFTFTVGSPSPNLGTAIVIGSETYTVVSVTSATAVVLDRPFAATASGISYSLFPTMFAVVGFASGSSTPTPTDDLKIILGPSFPVTVAATGSSTAQVFITVSVLYGAGRGLARRPDAIHTVAFYNPAADLLVQEMGVPSTNPVARVAWAPLWTRFRNQPYRNLLPSTSEVYADLGSKTVIVAPFRRVVWPSPGLMTTDGTSANLTPTATLSVVGTGATIGSTTFSDSSAPFLITMVGKALVVANGPAPGRYNIVGFGSTSSITLDRPIPTASGLSYSVYTAQGLMPSFAKDGVTAKWATPDPLQLFSGSTSSNAATKNIYVNFPREMIPGFGEFRVPILATDRSPFAEGINFMCLSGKGASTGLAAGDTNFVAYPPTYSAAVFSTLQFSNGGDTPAAYNTLLPTWSGISLAGMRMFTDTRGLGRQGLELPPFYGIARLYAVYEAEDWKLNQSAYDPTTRNALTGKATNLLRQNLGPNDGPTFWVELDADGDSTFILNANAIDITRSPNAIASFSAGNYVIECSVFGFDRGSFDITKEFRLVMAAGRTQAISSSRPSNVNTLVASPVGVLPGPATSSDNILINYSRTPYQGDPWGSQTSYQDITYSQGSMLSPNAYAVVANGLTQSALTRPNQKSLEVLASIGFATTLGTGRISGDTSTAVDVRDIGYEDPTQYPPTTGSQARPTVLLGGLANDTTDIGTQYLGASERLPLGALFRDKDFRGGSLGNGNGAPLVFFKSNGVGTTPASLAVNTAYEQTEITLSTSSVASGQPGDVIVHVDGNQTLYSQLTNFRVNRGGSAFTLSGIHPGGEVAVYQGSLTAPAGVTNAITGAAFLVRNNVTSVGANQVSAGDELMLFVITNVTRLLDTDAHPTSVIIGTNGTNEGYAAADLYRIEGHPLLVDNVRLDTDPSTIALSARVST